MTRPNDRHRPDDDGVLRRDYARTLEIHRHLDRLGEDVLGAWRGPGAAKDKKRRILAMAKACTRECKAIQATYEIPD